jgi:integrase
MIPPRAGDEAVRWEDIQWDRRKVHIRPEVAKITKRKTGGRRYVDLEAAIDHWIEPVRQETGRILPMTQKMLFRRLKQVEASAGVTIPNNGLRHSYCSYWLAANRDKGFSGLSMNAGSSEAVLRKHYTEILPEEEGLAYFALRRESVI